MTVDVITELLHREPFQPFRISLTSGESYRVNNPDLVALMKSKLFLAQLNPERGTYISYLHIAAVEEIGHSNGNGHRRRRRR